MDQQATEQTLQELHNDPRYQNLYGKAEAHQDKFRPKETARLLESNTLEAILHARTEACWETLRIAREAGMSMSEAQEVAFPLILVPSEK